MKVDQKKQAWPNLTQYIIPILERGYGQLWLINVMTERKHNIIHNSNM